MICSINFARAGPSEDSPTCQCFEPMTASDAPGAVTSSKRARSPPQTKSSSPAAASRQPPDTGAARKRAPVAPTAAASLAPVASSMVEWSR